MPSGWKYFYNMYTKLHTHTFRALILVVFKNKYLGCILIHLSNPSIFWFKDKLLGHTVIRKLHHWALLNSEIFKFEQESFRQFHHHFFPWMFTLVLQTRSIATRNFFIFHCKIFRFFYKNSFRPSKNITVSIFKRSAVQIIFNFEIFCKFWWKKFVCKQEFLFTLRIHIRIKRRDYSLEWIS